MSDLKIGLVFDAKSGRFKSEVKENTQLIQKLGATTQVTSGKTKQFGTTLDTTEKKLFSQNKIAQAVTLSLASMATGFSVGLLASQLSDTTKKFQVLRATLVTATGSVDDAGNAFDRLQVFASKTPFSVEESIQAFIKLKNLGLDPTEAALNSYGNTASAMGKSLDQFIEAVADASVSEFERLKEFGIKAKNQGDTIAFTFRKMKTEVANNAEAIEQYLQNLGENEFAGAMERQAATYDGALSNMGDSWDQLLLKISDDGAGDAMENVIRSITSNLDLLGNNTEAVADVFQFALVIAAGHAVNALSSKTAAVVKSTIATRAAAQADQVLAVSANNRAIQEQAAAKRSLVNASNTVLRTRAIKNLAIANGQLAASEKALTAATAKLNIATRIGGGAMALLGGPAGIAMLAGYAIYSFADSMLSADNKTQGLTRSLDEALGKQKELATNALNTDIDERMARIDVLQNKITAIHEKLAVGQNQKLGLFEKGVISDSIAEMQTLGGEITQINAKINELNSKSDKKTDPTKEQPISKKDSDNLAQVEKSLQTKEEAINASYLRRQGIVDKALLGKKNQEEKYNNLSLALELQKDEALSALALEKQAAEQSLRDEKVQAELNARELLDQHRRDSWETEIAELQGYHTRLESEEAAHNERVMQVKTRKTGELQGNLMQFANWQKKSETEKTSAVIGLGEKGFAAMAGQSKKAFAAYKAFSIAQALIKTYESATSAYAAMAPIPIVGPALGVAAAGVAVAMGLSQVNSIKSQKPQGYESGGNIGYNENVIEFGERNKPEVLEFEGKNYLLGGNGGAVFNRSQLAQAPNSTSGASTGNTNLTVNLIEDASKAGQVSQSKGLNNEDVIRIFVADIRNGGDSADAIELTYGTQRTGT